MVRLALQFKCLATCGTSQVTFDAVAPLQIASINRQQAAFNSRRYGFDDLIQNVRAINTDIVTKLIALLARHVVVCLLVYVLCHPGDMPDIFGDG